MENFLNRIIWGNTVSAYLMALAGIVVAWIVLRLIRKRLIGLLKLLASKTAFKFDDLLVEAAERFLVPYVYLLVNYNIILQLNLSAKADKILSAAMMIITGWYLIRAINFIFHRMVILYIERKNEPPSRIAQVAGMMMVVKATMWIIGAIMVADNLGYNVTTVIAGLGVGGIAIALAAQSILGDLFSYIVIFFDKPFEIGDFIIMNGNAGVVEKIGIKTTHIRSLDGQQLILPNSEMTKAVIQNFKRLQRRRVVFSIGVVYDTPAEKLRNIPAMLKEIVSSQQLVDFDRAHLRNFGDFSIQYEIVYYINSPDYVLYMDIQQEICLKMFEQFEAQGIEFAFPTRTLFLKGDKNITEKFNAVTEMVSANGH